MAIKGKLNWVKKHIAITALQKRTFDKLRKYEKRFGSDIFDDMLISYIDREIKSYGSVNELEKADYYQSIINDYEEKRKQSK